MFYSIKTYDIVKDNFYLFLFSVDTLLWNMSLNVASPYTWCNQVTVSLRPFSDTGVWDFRLDLVQLDSLKL